MRPAATAVSVGGDAAVFDVCDSTAFDEAVDKAVERHGHLDVMINNAGIAPVLSDERFAAGMANQLLRMEGRIGEMQPSEHLTSLSDGEWDRMIRVHLYGAFYEPAPVAPHATGANRLDRQHLLGARAATIRRDGPLRGGESCRHRPDQGDRPRGRSPGHSW